LPFLCGLTHQIKSNIACCSVDRQYAAEYRTTRLLAVYLDVMVISTTIRNVLFITIFAYICNADSVLRGGMHPRASRSVTNLRYECNCSSVPLPSDNDDEIHVKNCSCAERIGDPAVFSFNCSLAKKTLDNVLKIVHDNKRMVRRKRGEEMRWPSSGQVRYGRSLLPISAVREQPSDDDRRTAKVEQTSAEPSNKWEGASPVGERDTSGLVVGSIAEGSSAKKEETLPMSIGRSNGLGVDRTRLSVSHAETGEELSGGRREARPSEPSSHHREETARTSLSGKETGEERSGKRQKRTLPVNSGDLGGRRMDKRGSAKTNKTGGINFDFIRCLAPSSCNCTCTMLVMLVDDGGIECNCEPWATWTCSELNMWIHPDPRAKFREEDSKGSEGMTLLRLSCKL